MIFFLSRVLACGYKDRHFLNIETANLSQAARGSCDLGFTLSNVWSGAMCLLSLLCSVTPADEREPQNTFKLVTVSCNKFSSTRFVCQQSMVRFVYTGAYSFSFFPPFIFMTYIQMSTTPREINRMISFSSIGHIRAGSKLG